MFGIGVFGDWLPSGLRLYVAAGTDTMTQAYIAGAVIFGAVILLLFGLHPSGVVFTRVSPALDILALRLSSVASSRTFLLLSAMRGMMSCEA